MTSSTLVAEAQLIWITDGEDPPPEHPGLALCTAPACAARWNDEDRMPRGIRNARARGVIVACSAEASQEVRRMVRRLRVRFSGQTPRTLAPIAADIGLLALAQALTRWPANIGLDYASLAWAQSTGAPPGDTLDLLARGSTPLDSDARLLLALEHL